VQFLFAEHALDVERRELRRRDELIAIEPQVFDLLLYLVRNRDRVVSKDDLIEADGTPEQVQWFNDLQRTTTSPENAKN